MIKTFIKGIVTSCKKNDKRPLGYPENSYGVMMKINQLGSHRLPKGQESIFFLDIFDEVPIGAAIEFIYEVGEADE